MAKAAYQIRREIDGTIRTVQAHSDRGAMVSFLAEYGSGVDKGEEFRVKARGTTGWTWFRRTASGIRQFDGGS